MKLPALLFLISIVTLTPCLLYSQQNNSAGYTIIVKTIMGKYKGSLTAISDSSIEIKRKKFHDTKAISASAIQLIKVKKLFIKNVTYDVMLGAVAGAFLVVTYYVKNLFYTPGDPTFGRALWTTMAFGASAGLVYGSVESAFIRIRVPIHQAQYIFENKKGRLKKYITY